MKKTFKKIATVLGSTLMVGATIGAAAAANYPAPFVSNGNANVAIVYGANAALSDFSAATTVETDLAEKLAAQVTTGGSTTTGPASGDNFIRLDKSSNRLNFGDAIGGTGSPFGVTVDDDDMEVLLADGTYSADDNDDFDYEQKISLFNTTSLDHFRDSDYEDLIDVDERTPVVGFRYEDGDAILNYTLDFLDQPESDVDDGDLEDFEGSDITLFGKSYYVSDAKNGTEDGEFGKWTLLDSANKAIVNEGETTTVTVGDTTYEVSINFIDSDSAALTVNGETTDDLAEGQTEKLSSGAYIGVREVRKLEVAGTSGSVEFSIGSGKIEITPGSEIELNDENIDGVRAYINKGTYSSGIAKLDSIVVEWKAEDEQFLTSETMIEMPGFGNVGFSMDELVRPEEEEILIQNDGSTSIELKVPVKDGDASINILYADSDGNFTGIGKAEDERLATSNTSSLTYYSKLDGDNYHEEMVATYSTTSECESYVLSFDVDEDTTAGRNETTIKNEVTGESWSSRTEDDVFDIGDVSFTISTVGKNSTAEWVTLTAGSGVNFDTICSAGGLKIWLPFEGANSTEDGAIDYDGGDTGHDYDSFYLFMQGEDKDDNIESGTKFSVTLNNNADGEVEVSAINTTGGGAGTSNGGTTGLELGDTDVFEAYVLDEVAPRVLHTVSSSGQDTVSVYYPSGESQTYASVYLKESGSTISSDGEDAELGAVVVEDTEITSVQSKNLVVVGGSCINDVAAELLGSDESVCGDAFTAVTDVADGEYLIEVFDSPYTSGKVAMLAAGYNAADTTKAVTYLTNNDVDTSVGTKLVGSTANEATIMSETTAESETTA